MLFPPVYRRRYTGRTMCFSAQCWAAWRKYQREFKANISIKDFATLYGYRRVTRGIKIPKAMDAMFADPQTDDERAIKALIDEFNQAEELKQTQDLFKQKKRLAEAQRQLEVKATKKAGEDARIASDKIPNIERKLADLRRTDLKDRDSRMFPGWYVPVMISENGQRVVKPMRYQCRSAGKPAFYDRKYPGTYNAFGALLTVKRRQVLEETALRCA